MDVLALIENACKLYNENNSPASKKRGNIRAEILAVFATKERRLKKLKGLPEKAEV